MYPLTTEQPWARNQWYAAAWSSEVSDQPIERTILGQRVLLYRTSSGAAAALAGLCPHRFMPLVKGVRSGDTIECPYHGMTFGADGECLTGPAGAVPAGRLRSFPAIELGPLVWIWTGENSEPGLAPDLAQCGIDAEGWRADANGTMHFDARYMLLVDNLFDLSHISWVHSSLLGKPSICTRKPTVEQDDALLTFERREVGPVDPFTQYLFPEVVGPIEATLSTRMFSPGVITALGPSVSEAEGSPRAGEHLGDVHFVHIITPETAHSTMVYSVVTRNFRLDDDDLSAGLCAQNKAVLSQDKEVAEAIEAGLGSADTNNERSYRTDRGGIEARRIISALILAELADETSPALAVPRNTIPALSVPEAS